MIVRSLDAEAIAPIRVLRCDRGELDAQARRFGTRNKMDLAAVQESVRVIVDDVRARGDAALLAWTERLDKAVLTADQLRVGEDEIGRALDTLDFRMIDILRRAAANIRDFHQAQRSDDVVLPTAGGGELALRARSLNTVGVYVPGGTAPLPSSVLMNVLPARAAGVCRVILTTPPRADGSVHPAILAAAAIAGADEVYRIGGAQAVAALAYGSESVPAVDKVVGPGNIYVNTAKRLVFGQVDIDGFYGPSEILIIADKTADAEQVAADMIAQAEHDTLASAILVTTDGNLATQAAEAVRRRAERSPRREILRRSLADYAVILVVADLDDALTFSEMIAPEHLELLTADADRLARRVRNAGAVFIGPFSPEPLGDYFAGPNHVLPTSGTARFASPLQTADFIKKTSYIRYTRDDLEACWQDIVDFAEREELPGHAESVRARFAPRP